MDAILQVAAVGALLALTALIVLADAGVKPSRHRSPRGEQRVPRRDRHRGGPEGGRAPAGDGGTAPGVEPGVETGAQTATRPGPASPTSLGMGSIQAAWRSREIGRPAAQPDPDRLIQTEILELAGPAARLGALIRLVFWLLLGGLGIGLAILGAVRGIAIFVENLLGV